MLYTSIIMYEVKVVSEIKQCCKGKYFNSIAVYHEM